MDAACKAVERKDLRNVMKIKDEVKKQKKKKLPQNRIQIITNSMGEKWTFGEETCRKVAY